MDLITAVDGEQALEMIVDLAVKKAIHLILSSNCSRFPSFIYAQRRPTRSTHNPRYHASEVPHRADHMHLPYL